MAHNHPDQIHTQGRCIADRTGHFPAHCNDLVVILTRLNTSLGTFRNSPGSEQALSTIETEKVADFHGGADKDIVIEIEKIIGETLDVMKIQLDSWRREGGEGIRLVEDLIMCNDADFGVCQVEPIRNLAICDDVDVADPGSIDFEGSNAVSRKKHQRTNKL